MADNDIPETLPETEKPAQLNEFCRNLSLTDKRVELIAGFHSSEVRAGKLTDTESAYSERYAAFADTPVK